MEPLCAYEKRKCVNYGFEEWPIVEVVRPGVNFKKSVNHMLILYIKEGLVNLAFGTTKRYLLGEGQMMLFPPGTRVSGSVVEGPVTVVMFKMKHDVMVCDKYVFGDIGRNIDPESLSHIHLDAHQTVKMYMDLLVANIEDGMTCFKFMELKITELFHYLKSYYNKAQLAGFALPLMSPNSRFMFFIWNNYRKVHNVNQFARLANCSLSAFKVRFKNVTGMPPSQWLTEQKARNVFHEISCGDKSLKEISEEYHFSSVSHLGTFCRKNFGKSPGSLKPGPSRGESAPELSAAMNPPKENRRPRARQA